PDEKGSAFSGGVTAANDFVPIFLPPLTSTVGDVSLFDNIYVRAHSTFKTNFVPHKYGVYCFDKMHDRFPTIDTTTEAGRKHARDMISDHRPIYAAFRTD